MLQGRRLSELVEARLGAMIRSGEVAEGEALPSERQLMELFEVGRPSVREALFALQRKGLVKLRRGSSPVVSRPSPAHLLKELGDVAGELIESQDGVRHFDQARLFIETSIARHAAVHADEAALARIAAALAANEAAIGHAVRFVKTDVAFHRVLTETTGNPVLLAMHDAMVEWVILRRPAVADPTPHNRNSFERHRAIVAAIVARDPEAAGRLMQIHLEEAATAYAKAR